MGVKLSLIVDGRGMPLALSLAPGNVHDGALGYLTVRTVYHPPPALRSIYATVRPAQLVLLGDKGYDSLQFRRFVREHGYLPDIPKRRGIPIDPGEEALYAHDSTRFKRRYVIERTNGWLKTFRRLHFRVDRTTVSFEAFLYLAVIVICARRALG